jgi:hypothetical protein
VLFRLVADLVVVVHAAFVVFAVFGSLAVVYRPRLAWLHVPAVAWAALVELAGWTCPLTPLENHLRTLAGGAGYEGGFVERYLVPAIYPESLTREVQLLLGATVVAINVGAYGWIVRSARRARARR